MILGALVDYCVYCGPKWEYIVFIDKPIGNRYRIVLGYDLLSLMMRQELFIGCLSLLLVMNWDIILFDILIYIGI